MIADATTTLLTIVIIGALVVWAAGFVLKEAQKTQGKARCKFCNARLKFQGFSAASKGSGVAGYAKVCRSCGRAQP